MRNKFKKGQMVIVTISKGSLYHKGIVTETTGKAPYYTKGVYRVAGFGDYLFENQIQSMKEFNNLGLKITKVTEQKKDNELLHTEKFVKELQKNKEMTTTSKKITLKQATELLNSKTGMKYPETEHNKKMIAKAVDNQLKELQKNKAAKKPTTKIVQLDNIEIVWAEGDNANYDKFPKKYKSWKDAHNAVKPIFNDFAKDGIEGGYNKVKFKATWKDGETYEGRLDVSTKEDNPTKTPNVFGKHIFDYQTYRQSEGAKDVKKFFETYSLTDVKAASTPKKVAPKKVAVKKDSKKVAQKGMKPKAGKQLAIEVEKVKPKTTAKNKTIDELLAGTESEKVLGSLKHAVKVKKAATSKDSEIKKISNQSTKIYKGLKTKCDNDCIKKAYELAKDAWADIKKSMINIGNNDKVNTTVKIDKFYDYCKDNFADYSKKTSYYSLPDSI